MSDQKPSSSTSPEQEQAPAGRLTDQQIAAQASGRASWHRRASKPVSAWMLLLVLAVFAHPWIPQAIWLLVHMVTLGLITNSILIWSQHFTEALLKHKCSPQDRKKQVSRIYLLNLATVSIMVGILFNLLPLTYLGSTGLGLVLTWHGLALLSQLRAALPARFAISVRYYILACWLLPLGALFGALLASPQTDSSWRNQLLLAHQSINILGFVGITLVGTLLTLWPTMLRTGMHPQSLRLSRIALIIMSSSLLVITAACLLGLPYLAAAGLISYSLGVCCAAALMLASCRKKKPSDYPTLSVAAGICWLLISCIWAAILLASTPLSSLNLRPLTPVFVAGFLLQILLGAMSYLLPVRMGGGPSAVRAANTEFNRFSFGRVSIINLSLLIFILPADLTGSWVRAGVSLLGAAAYASFLVLMLRGVKKSIAARKKVIAARAQGKAPVTAQEPLRQEKPKARRELLLGSGLTLATLAGALALDPSASGLLTAGKSTPNDQPNKGTATRVRVNATADMRFEPDQIQVAHGQQLIIDLYNTDTSNIHDLALSSGAHTGRVNPGASSSLDAGVITGNLDGWCTILGHRAMGMTLQITVSGLESSHQDHATTSADTVTIQDIDLKADIGADYRVRQANLEDFPSKTQVHTHRHTFEISEVENEIAPGLSLSSWTFGGKYMGPTLQGNLGDQFEITLINKGSMGHSIDFHAGMVSPDRVMRTIAPDQQLTYRFEAKGSGLWLYHCSTAPMSTHIASGMFGAVLIAPDSLEPVARQYLLVQNETYLIDSGTKAASGNKLVQVSPEAVDAGRPSLTMWNGHASQYVAQPLEAKVGERIRIWVLAAGPSQACSFHVVGTQFDTVYKEGSYLLRGGQDAFGVSGGHSQALDLQAAQGGFVEMEFLEAGTYTFVNHDFAQMERGARGLIKVSA